MVKRLERDLGLYAVFTVSVGAMIGSGIFILPALATPLAGPSVVLAYGLAGLIVLPAALSKSEMATAMPQAGGTYLYIDRAMGPLMGTVAGIGTWFSLTFKSALALVGGAPYIVLLLDLPVQAVAVVIGVALIAVNVAGVKHTGWLQVVIVTVMVVALLGFVYAGITWVEADRFHPFYTGGVEGLLAATGLVFVSYAGVTKIASVAEEVEDPGRNIPLGMLGSLAFTTLLYVLIVYVLVGVTDAGALAASLTPVANAAEFFLGPAGILIMVLAAILALVSTANAGILSASRYPLAMSRDALAPERFSRIHANLRTPINAITLTGGIMLALVVFVPILEIAKLASAFKILVFILINVALIAFRESGLPEYEPEFRSPLYPLVQVFGIVGGLVLLTQMGTVPMVGAAAIIGIGLLWYRVYGRERTEREGVAIRGMREAVAEKSVEETRQALWTTPPQRVLVPLDETSPPGVEPTLVRLGLDLVKARGGEVVVARFEEVPEQVSLGMAAGLRTEEDEAFEERVAEAAERAGAEAGSVEAVEVVSHDLRRALRNTLRNRGVDLVVVPAAGASWRRRRPLSRRLQGVVADLSTDVLVVRDRGLDRVDRVGIVADEGAMDPLKVAAANGIAVQEDASVRLIIAAREDASDARLETLRGYLDELASLCGVPTETHVVQGARASEDLLELLTDVDLVVVSSQVGRGRRKGGLADTPAGYVVDKVDATVVAVHRARPRQSPIRRLLERLAF